MLNFNPLSGCKSGKGKKQKKRDKGERERNRVKGEMLHCEEETRRPIFTHACKCRCRCAISLRQNTCLRICLNEINWIPASKESNLKSVQ
jgi:hypothetical protein